MSTQIYLGLPPPNVVKWIKDEVERKYQEMLKTPLTFTAEEDGSWIKYNYDGYDIKYSVNDSEWTGYNSGTQINLNKDDFVRFSANGSNDTVEDSQFEMDGRIAASGNIQSLLDETCQRMDVPAYCYWSIFEDCTSLTKAPILPAMILDEYCYSCMFSGCSSLTQAPELPATELAKGCYDGMLQGCLSLTKAPTLPAAILVDCCYSYMFYDCSSLTNAYFPNLDSNTVINEVVGNQEAFEWAADNIETQCSDGIIIINSTKA